MFTTIGIGALVLLFLGVPLWMIFLSISIVATTWMGVSMEVVIQQLMNSINKIVLLAVPGFIFAGEVMGRGGMSRRLINWVSALLGPVPGGMPLTTLGASEVFGAISGSSSATVAALGKILYPGLRQNGYSEKFSLGLITSAGAIAIIIPPSITMILYAVMTSASVGRLFIAGILPGVLVGTCIAVYSIGYALKHKITSGRRWDLREIGRTTKDVLWTLGAPALIFGGIYGGFMTPTEAAMAVAVYAVFVSVVIYREISWKDIWEITRNSSELTAKIFIIVASAGVFSWVLTAEQVPQQMVTIMSNMNLSPFMILIMINVILLLAGMFMDPNSAIVLLTPLLWPIASAIGVDIIHFGIIFTVNLAIGMFSPPFGLNIFVSSSIFKVSSSRITSGLLPFFVAYLLALLLITYWPALSLTLPNILFN